MTSLEKALVQLSRILARENIPYMVIGGMANAVWGEPRATLDIDITVWVVEEDIENFVNVMTEHFEPLVPAPLSFISETRVLPLQSPQGIRIDCIFGGLPYEMEAINRAVELDISGSSMRFCAPEDLIIHKIISQRSKDLEDVRGIIFRRIKSLDTSYLELRIKQLSDALARPDIWRLWQDWKQDAQA